MAPRGMGGMLGIVPAPESLGGGFVLHNAETLGRINVQGGHGCGSFASCQIEGGIRGLFRQDFDFQLNSDV
jgi:hypothetical protein